MESSPIGPEPFKELRGRRTDCAGSVGEGFGELTDRRGAEPGNVLRGQLPNLPVFVPQRFDQLSGPFHK
jgi:hypothetical protein